MNFWPKGFCKYYYKGHKQKGKQCKLPIHNKHNCCNANNVKYLIKGRTKCSKVITIKRFCEGAGITLSEFFNKDYFNFPEID